MFEMTPSTIAPGAVVQAGTDAVFSINGVALPRTNNTVTDALSGVTLQLLAAEAGAVTSLTVDRSNSSAKSAMQAVTDANVGFSSPFRGLFMWRADGTGGTDIVANDDAGQVDSPHPGAAVANVLANDQLAGGPATVANVTLTQVSTTNQGVTLNPADGSVNVAYGVRVGDETLRYRICETARLANCDEATVLVTIAGNRIDANDDAGATKTGGGTAVANLLANDTFAGGLATLQQVTLEVVSSDPSLTVGANGSLSVEPGTPAGSYQMSYRICETVNLTNCDQADGVVTVTAYSIVAVDDQGSAQSSPGGIAVANVVANDQFDGAPATAATVQLSLVSASVPGLTLDLNDGSVDVAPGTAPGSQSLVYRICEAASPTNCDTATVAVTVTPQGYIVSKDRHNVNEGSGGSFTVRLSQPPTGNVVVSVSYLAGTMNVTFAPAALTFTPATWNTAQTVTFGTPKDSGKEDNAGTLQLVSPGIATKHVVINGLDKDRKATHPMPTLQAPYNGQTVSGTVSIWGTATDSDGTLVDGRFSIDGVRISTVVNPTGTFRPPLWNSATVPNGWHTVEFRVTDNGGNDGRVIIKVFVNN